jgi:hypothetical protein
MTNDAIFIACTRGYAETSVIGLEMDWKLEHSFMQSLQIQLPKRLF